MFWDDLHILGLYLVFYNLFLGNNPATELKSSAWPGWSAYAIIHLLYSKIIIYFLMYGPISGCTWASNLKSQKDITSYIKTKFYPE